MRPPPNQETPGAEKGCWNQGGIHDRPYRDAFFEMYKLICISLTLSVSSAGCERSFSCLKLQKNYLRSISGEDRTSNLGGLAINRDRTALLDRDEIVDKFAHSHGNKRITLI